MRYLIIVGFIAGNVGIGCKNPIQVFEAILNKSPCYSRSTFQVLSWDFHQRRYHQESRQDQVEGRSSITWPASFKAALLITVR